MIESSIARVAVFLFPALFLSMASVASAQSGGPPPPPALDGFEDFARISEGGFRQTVQGNYPTLDELPDPDNLPDGILGSGRNSYSWSMEWYNDGNGDALYVGTVRDILCASGLDFDLSAECPDFSTLPPGFNDNSKAEIWKYTPESPLTKGGANGSWARIFQSPVGGFSAEQGLVDLILEQAGIDFNSIPRDIGIRTHASCQTLSDTVPGLYATTSGLPGNILYYDVDATGDPGDLYYKETSHVGLKAALANFLPTSVGNPILDIFLSLIGASFDGDIGYRGLACFNGYLMTSPASSVNSGSEDVSENPVLLGNSDPAGGAPWSTIVNFRTAPSLGDPNNFGAFDMIVVGGDLWVAVSNRSRDMLPNPDYPATSDEEYIVDPDGFGGFELWRGDGANFGTECEAQGAGCTMPGTISWTKVIDDGAGRPYDDIDLGPSVDNSLGTFGTLDGKLYIGTWESGFFEAGLAELIRVDPVSDTPGSETWELLVGHARPNYTDQNGGGEVFEKMACDGTLQEYIEPFDVNPAPECYPSSGRDRGFGPPLAKGTRQCASWGGNFIGCGFFDTLSLGGASYFWRFGEHDGIDDGSVEKQLYMGSFNFDSLDFDDGSPNEETGGFELYRTTPAEMGRDWLTIDTRGFGNPFNYGVRSFKSTPLGLFVGTANPFTNAGQCGALDDSICDESQFPGVDDFKGGTEVYLGTLDSQLAAPPITNPGPDVFVIDDENYPDPGDGSEMITLDGSGSGDPHGGTIESYEWFDGDVSESGSCLAEDTANKINTDTSNPAWDVNPAAGNPNSDGIHLYTLRTTDDEANMTCAVVEVIVSNDLLPSVTIATDMPMTSGRVNLVDFDNNGTETLEVTGTCFDPEGSVFLCAYFPDAGVSIPGDPTGAPFPGGIVLPSSGNPVTRTFTVQNEAVLAGGDTTPDITLAVADGLFQISFDDFSVRVQTVTDTVDVNDRPVCTSAIFTTKANTPIFIDPFDVTNRLCQDPDDLDSVLTLTTKDPQPNQGTATVVASPSNGFLYTPDEGAAGVDEFRIELFDDDGSDSIDVDIKVIIEDNDVSWLPSVLDLLLE